MVSYPMVVVIWVDAESNDLWEDIDDLDHKPKEIITLGHMMKDDDDSILVAMNLDPENESVSMTMTIPTQFIVSLKII